MTAEPMKCATVGGIHALTEERARFVYDAARLQAMAVGAPVVPEPYNERDGTFQAQFREIIERQMGEMRSGSPAELHGGWVQAYIGMGWHYGTVRDTEAKTHPDMVPFDKLEKREQDKDAVFIALCEIARLWIQSENGNQKESPTGIKSEDIKPVDECPPLPRIDNPQFVGKWVQISDAVLRRYLIDQEDDDIVHFCEGSRPEGRAPVVDTWWNKSQCTIVEGPFQHPALPTSREWLESDGGRGSNEAGFCFREMVESGNRMDNYCSRSPHDSGWHVFALSRGVYARGYTDGPFTETK